MFPKLQESAKVADVITNPANESLKVAPKP
jgi:hypothetical protein